jgi:hypothetical protein
MKKTLPGLSANSFSLEIPAVAQNAIMGYASFISVIFPSVPNHQNVAKPLYRLCLNAEQYAVLFGHLDKKVAET